MSQPLFKLTRDGLAAWHRPLAFLAALWLVMSFVHGSSFRDVIDDGLARPLEFRVRKHLGLEPLPSQNLKILSFDDTMMSWYGDSELSREDWGKLFDTLRKQGVRRILVDKIFALPPKSEAGDEGDDSFVAALDAGAPVIAGSFFIDREIKGREGFTPPADRVKLQDADWVPFDDRRHFYGPHASIASHFKLIGSIVYAGKGYVESILRVTAHNAIAHSALLLADAVTVDADGVRLDGRELPLDPRHRLLINLPNRAKLDNFSLKVPLMLARAGKPIPGIASGDTVVILPLMYTGNTDFKDSPMGEIPGGNLILSVANSVLTNNWLNYRDAGVLGLLITALFAGVFGLLLPAATFSIALITGTLALAAVGLGLFAKFGIVTDWVWVVGMFDTASLATFIYKSRRHEAQARRAREALSGLVPEQRLAEIINDPSLVRFEPSEKVLTLMFIDIVGFSTVAETKTPQQVFSDLKEAIGRITRIVHEFDGFVDRTLGDGLLCYFGYAAGTSATSTAVAKMNHAEQAIACAMAIQRASIAMTQESAGTSKPVFPLRIGINTAGVFLGDLGDGRRLDYTVIGHGVNFSQRLEAACEPYRVMVSGTSYDLANRLPFRDRLMRKRLIQVKHHKESFEVYELIPVEGANDILTQAQSIFNKSIGMSRLDERWPVPPGIEIRMASDHGVGVIVNYSRQGFSIRMKAYLARAFQTTFEFEGMRSSHHVQIGSIHGEVRWGRPMPNDEFLHGILIKNLSELDTDIFVHQLHAICRKRRVAGDGEKVEPSETGDAEPDKLDQKVS